MKRITDNEAIRDAIELFIIRYFDDIDMSGTVNHLKNGDINYFSIDLNEKLWDNDLLKLHSELRKYLTEWAKINSSSFSNYKSVATLTIDYLLPEKDGSNQNTAKILRLFYLSPFYYESNNIDEKIRNNFIIKFYKIYNRFLLRNLIIVSIPIIGLIIFSIIKYEPEELFIKRLAKSFEFVNVASGIIGSFILGYIINKVLILRQDKLNRTKKIKDLSNKLTYFRNVCYNFINDGNYWTQHHPYYKAYQHGNSIKDIISYEDYFYPDYKDDIKYAKYKSTINDDVSNSIVLLVLQLEMMAGKSLLRSRLTYTEFPLNYVYSFKEMEMFSLLIDANQIWCCCTNANYIDDNLPNTYSIGEVIKDIRRIDKKYKKKFLTKDNLASLSLDFQYRIIPNLYRLTKLNEAPIPFTLRYFLIIFILLLAFGIIIPSLTYIFISNELFAFINTFLVIGIISHVLLSLYDLLKIENTIDKRNDF